MATRNYFSIAEALQNPTYARELVVFLYREGESDLMHRIKELENLTSLTLLDNEAYTEISESVYSLQKLENFRLRGLGVKAISESFGQLKLLRHIHIENCPIVMLPKSIGNCVNLKSISIEKTNLESLPDEICNLKNIKSLDIEFSKLVRLPENIGALDKLTKLSIENGKLNELPESLEKLQLLETLSLSKNEFIDFPTVICRLIGLRDLYLNDNQLSTLPESFSKLTFLRFLRLDSNSFEQFPEQLCSITQLQYLYLYDNKLADLPQSIVNLDKLTALHIYGNPFPYFPFAIFDWFSKVKLKDYAFKIDTAVNNNNEILDLLKNATFQKSDRQTKVDFFNIYTGNPAAKEIPLNRLLLALNSAATRIADLTLGLLTENYSRPLKSGDKVFLMGKTALNLETVKEQAAACDIQIQEKLTGDATHLLISARANKIPKSMPEKPDWQWINEGQLTHFFDAVNPSYLVESAETDAQKVSDMIMTLDEDNMSLAVSLVEGGGLPDNLITELFIVYKMSNSEETSKRALQLLKQKAGPELLTVLKNRSKINKKPRYYFSDSEQREIREKLIMMTKDSGIDLGKLAYTVHLNSKICIDLVLDYADIELSKLAIARSLRQDEFYMSYNEKVRRFPKAFLGFSQMKKLKLNAYKNSENTIEAGFYIPEEIYKMESLLELEIAGTVLKTLPISSLSKIKNLSKLSVWVKKDFDTEALKAALPFCKTILQTDR